MGRSADLSTKRGSLIMFIICIWSEPPVVVRVKEFYLEDLHKVYWAGQGKTTSYWLVPGTWEEDGKWYKQTDTVQGPYDTEDGTCS